MARGPAPADGTRLRDTVRPDAAALIARLRALGVGVKMLTGDALPIATEIAQSVGLSSIRRLADLKAVAASRTILKASFVAAAFLATGKFVVSALGMILLVFMTDFAKISLSTDRVRGCDGGGGAGPVGRCLAGLRTRQEGRGLADLQLPDPALLRAVLARVGERAAGVLELRPQPHACSWCSRWTASSAPCCPRWEFWASGGCRGCTRRSSSDMR
jgi:hypothetical protein